MTTVELQRGRQRTVNLIFALKAFRFRQIMHLARSQQIVVCDARGNGGGFGMYLCSWWFLRHTISDVNIFLQCSECAGGFCPLF